jgi:dephospho-CoA kinase
MSEQGTVVIGLTGNFGTGKTTVSQVLARLGAAVINADELGHEFLKPGTEAYREIVSTFGTSFLEENGEIDRHRLAQLVFSSPERLARLNQIMHPRMYRVVEEMIAEYRRKGVKAVVLEAALLIEAGWTPLVDKVWVTVSPQETIVQRLKKARGLYEEQILARLSQQMPSEEKTKRADAVIDTNCTLEELEHRVTELWRQLFGGAT